ncbi:870_t:CDS:2, partial [Diversispora eburnea]
LAKNYFEYIKLSYSLALKQDVETKCWKNGFYTLIEGFRNAINIDRLQSQNHSSSSTIILKQFGIFLDEAETFYKRLLKQIALDISQNGKPINNNKPPKWIRCVNCLGDINRYRWAYELEKNSKNDANNENDSNAKNNADESFFGVMDNEFDLNASEDKEMNKDFWAKNASRWYRLGIQLNSNNGKFYHHLGILTGYNEFKSLYYFCRSLSVNTPFLAARESLIALFESNRKRFSNLTTNKHKQKGRRGYLYRENSQPKSVDVLTKLPIECLFSRLHGMLFTKIGLENFENILKIFLEKLNKWENPCSIDDSNETRWLETYLKMAVINLSSMYNYGSKEGSSHGQVTLSCANTDPAFPEKTRLTFSIMGQFMSKYFETIILQEGVNTSEGWLLYCEVVMLWMVSSGAFDGFGNENHKSIWEAGRFIFPNFWKILAKFLTKVAHQVSSFTKEEILNSCKNQNHEKISLNLLRPPLSEDWELRGISWLQPLYETYLSDLEVRPHIKFDESESDNTINIIYEERKLCLDQNAKSQRRARIMELGYILSKKISGFTFNAEDTKFSACPELDAKLENSLNMESNLLPVMFIAEEQKPTKESKPVNIEDQENEINDYAEDDDEGIKELKSRRQELENLLAATRNNIYSSSAHKHPVNDAKKKESSKKTKSPLLRIVPGYTILVVDTNCLVGDLNMVKKIIYNDSWVVVIPLVVVTELDGLRFNSPPLGTAASDAIAFLEQAMSNKKKLKIQTSRGNYVSGINFSEEFDFGDGEDKKKNLDDLILGICLWHAKNQEENGSYSKTSKEKINNEKEAVVLLTNDRNLRIKARARGIDVIGAQDLAGLI